MARSNRTAHAAAGFSLVEVLVSIALLSLGLLGAAAMLLHAVRASGEAANFGAALNLVRELSEKTRLNRAVSGRRDAANGYLVAQWTAGSAAGEAGVTDCAAAGAACRPEDLARWDMQAWKRRAAKALPGARITVCFDGNPWNDAAGAHAWDCEADGPLLVVKLGWLPRNASEAQHRAGASAPPRLAMPLMPAQASEGPRGG
ncbi:type IV pilus modification protein PilV [Variovorax paradoxus]|uniref:type IV pilus modification protein PilV n=1 Tax=Variovorax paradoxus TaxID=34073 RepID=UPI001ABD096E